MSDDRRSRLRFSLSTLLLLVAIVGLTVALFMAYQRISELEGGTKPLTLKEVARQFEKQTSLGAVTVKVNDVRYSPKEDAYRVEFSWIDPKTKQNWQTEVQLNANGYGKYFGAIASGQFMLSQGSSGQFTVVVETPSSFKP